jgi:hypothetical protein
MGKHGQRLPTFNNAYDLLHGFEQGFPQSAEAHDWFPGWCSLLVLSINKQVEAGAVDTWCCLFFCSVSKA